ncbi:2'-5' RNA ligase family protein [Leptothoe kymatousa]|uniref:2'-5' RNA ligase family protein n=1 Tax=Leptothoe kymatousa TAU-MAC 1615 TaxID=2364775 RepID=A0ABS5XYN0_9CYAN|nr:2'-5' RNA ligase family protein [Leptothoe kymatousa]MBT9310742.1 2'-5' RNA ligase family protein [Leptothoe kymatousa TAU-MAC 1615]
MYPQKFFIALLPPPEVQTSIHQIKEYFAEHYGSRKAFNSPPHITLQAPFELSSPRQLTVLTDGLRIFVMEREKIAIALRNFAAFPPKVIYVDVVQSPGLMSLQSDLAQLMTHQHGITERHYRSFCPHMTVAFRDLTPAAFHQAWPEFQHKPLAVDFTAQQVTLLRHDGQRWQIHQEYPLGQPAPTP